MVYSYYTVFEMHTNGKINAFIESFVHTKRVLLTGESIFKRETRIII